jgi:hypothetical protein
MVWQLEDQVEVFDQEPVLAVAFHEYVPGGREKLAQPEYPQLTPEG